MKTNVNIKPLALIMLFSFFFFMPQFSFGSDIAGELQTLWDDNLKPILNVVVGIAVAIAAVWAAIQFFMGKREALKTFGYVLLGALVIRFLPDLVLTFMGN